jgi:DNA-binding CsgD family transcriptional regulator
LAGAIGRDAELAVASAFLDAVPEGPASIEIEGEAGIGKTVVLREVLQAARDRSYRVLSCAAVEAEAKLSYTALTDLLASVTDDEMASMRSPQQHALEVALLRAEPGEARADRRALSVALVSLLQELARRETLIVAIDDARWLDRASAAALTFAVRRLDDAPIGIIVSTRPGEEDAVPLGLDDAIAAERRIHLAVAPLTTAALFQVMQQTLDTRMPRPLLLRVHGQSGGNPFYALELVRALVASRQPLVAATDLPLPETLAGVARRRLDALPPDGRDALLVIAAAGAPTPALVSTVTGAEALAEAVAAGVVTVDADRVRFAHPLLGSAAYAAADAPRRREVHGRLAELLEQPEERARHLALASEAPDAGVAAALEQGADQAWRRGTPEAAAELALQAVTFTAPGDERYARRQVTAARLLVAAGDMPEARHVLETAMEGAGSAHDRFEACQLLAEIERRAGNARAAVELMSRAGAEAVDAPDLRAQAMRDLAMHHTLAGQISDAEPCITEAVAAAEVVGDPALIATTLVARAVFDFFAGRGLDHDAMDRALPMSRHDADVPLEYRVDTGFSSLLSYSDELDAARALVEPAFTEAMERGRLFDLGSVLTQATQLELRAGNWERAAQHAEAALEAASLVGAELERALALWVRADVRAHRGDIDAARADVESARAIAFATSSYGIVGFCMQVLAFLDLSLGDAAAAHAQLGPMMQVLLASEIRDPFVLSSAPDDVEAMVALGLLDEAATLLDEYEARARAVDRKSALSAAARCRGLLLAAGGDVAAAIDAVEEAVAVADALPMPFEQGRALLVLGQLRRRNKEKAPARDALEHAQRLFDGLGARLWSAKAAQEMERLGIRQTAGVGLTPTEARTASLAAAGRTNQEIAGELFVSIKTVEANLSRVYSKLGIRRRAELSSRLVDLEQTDRQ